MAILPDPPLPDLNLADPTLANPTLANPTLADPTLADPTLADPTLDPTGAFAAAMARLGPFEPCPRLAVAVSGGADSMALALLAQEWAGKRGGGVRGLIVDHGLRPEAAAEAALTRDRLAARGIEARILTLAHLARGPSLAERAREARYRRLLDACAAGGLAHLLLGHHRGDQVETVMTRVLSASGARGLAGMPALRETGSARVLRPLLRVPPVAARAFLTARGEAWIEDPSNRDPAARRARLRARRADPDGTGGGTVAVAVAARTAGAHRAKRDAAIADALAARATIWPEGHALLTPGPIEPEALAALLRTLAGAAHAPAIDRVAALARDLRPATLGGVRILAAGRLGAGWLLTREGRGMAPPVAARPGAFWDGRFRVARAPADPSDSATSVSKISASATSAPATLGALGADAARFRDRRGPPMAVLLGLPAVRRAGVVVAVPHMGVGDPGWLVLFEPRNPAACAPFVPG